MTEITAKLPSPMPSHALHYAILASESTTVASLDISNTNPFWGELATYSNHVSKTTLPKHNTPATVTSPLAGLGMRSVQCIIPDRMTTYCFSLFCTVTSTVNGWDTGLRACGWFEKFNLYSNFLQQVMEIMSAAY